MTRKTGLLLAIILVLVLAGVLRYWPGDTPVPEAEWTPPAQGLEPVGPGAGYLRGAHWFGEGWAVNFWNTRLLERAADDFRALRADGFNTVVLVVPWPGFSPTPNDGSLDPDRLRRLRDLLDLAEESGLNVVLRLGYAWDSSVERAGSWLMELWLDETVRQAWLSHIESIWALVEERDVVRFAFISWEDLWAITGVGAGDRAERLRLAHLTGYREWLMTYSDLSTVSARYGERFRTWNEVPVPQRMHPSFGLFFDFVDHAWIERFFKPAQAVFPSLSMEVRIDSDPVWNAPGELAYWHSHELAWDLPGAPWTTVYWAPAMGGANEGETLEPETAVERLRYQMERLRRVTGDRPIFVDQFLVEDFTPGYEMNGRLERSRVDEFLELAAPVLRSMTHGYALWTWRDYRHNAVPSPDFFRVEDNWTGQRTTGTEALSYPMAPGERLERNFYRYEFHAPGGPEQATVCVEGVVDGDPSPDLRITAGEGRQRGNLDVTGSGLACRELSLGGETKLVLEALEDLELFSVSFSGFTQPTGIRDLEGAPKPVAKAWRALNDTLVTATPAPFEPFDDGWMGKTLTARLRDSGAEPSLNFDTRLPGNWPFVPQLTVRVNGETVATVPCEDDTTHALPLDAVLRMEGEEDVALTVDRTYRPPGDERRLGCRIENLDIVAGD